MAETSDNGKLKIAYDVLEPQLFELTRSFGRENLNEDDRQRLLLERVLIEGMLAMAIYGINPDITLANLLQSVTRERIRLLDDSINPQPAILSADSALLLSVEMPTEGNGGLH